MKKIYLTKGFKMVIWLAIFGVGAWGYWQFSGGMSAGDPSSGSALISEIGLSDDSSSLLSPMPVAANRSTNSSGGLVPALDEGSESGGSNDAITDAPGDDSGVGSYSADAPGVQSQSAAATDSADDSASLSAPASAPAPVCSMADANSDISARAVIFNEIAWMGSLPMVGETSAKAGEREWIELKNISSGTVDISGWQIFHAAGSLKIGTSTDTKIPAGGFYLLGRDGAAATDGSGAAVAPDAGYSGGLSNAGDKLVLFDANCNTVDFLDVSTGWPGGNNTTKQTLERDADGVGWHTSASPGGTPLAENSAPAPIASVAPISSSVSSAQYPVSVSLVGAGAGTVSSIPAGIICGFQCEAGFSAGTKISFSESAESGSVFKGWMGACGGSTVAGITVPQCSFTVSSSVAVVAEFDPIATEPSSTATMSETSVVDSSVGADSSDDTGNSAGHLLIAAIQIAGAESSNDFVKIFNPTGVAIDLTGWKLHKKSSTGADYSLKSFVAGNSIAPGGYFEWANSEDGFADSIGADASSTETLSADNSVALFDANGNIVDQVAWGTGADQYVEGSAYPTDPTAGQILARQSAAGTMIDTDNNVTDFAIQ